MADALRDTPRQPISQRGGVLVAFIAVVLAGAPYVGKAYLRGTVPPVLDPETIRASVREQRATGVMQFLENQRQKTFESAMSLAMQMDSGSCRGLPKKPTSLRETVATLSDLDLRVEQALKAECAEEQWPFGMFHENENARRIAERRARHLDNLMMAFFTLAGAGFLVSVSRSQALPNWAKAISMMAAGAILAGWFPL